MTERQTPSAVVVGIDGSPAAIKAAVWAIDEAIERDVPLRLVFSIDSEALVQHGLDQAADRAYALASLEHACMAIAATGRPVKVETDIVSGDPRRTLVELSKNADLVCVGSVGIGFFASKLLGSVADELARSAHCPVAVIRRHTDVIDESDWIAVVVDGSPETWDVIDAAVAEARRRGAGLLALGVWRGGLGASHAEGSREVMDQLEHILGPWQTEFSGLRIQPVPVRGNALEYLAVHAKSIPMVVIGASRGRFAEQLIGPAGHAVLHHANCSVLIVRSA